ncbi:MAG: glycosyltransferase [Acidimicrobiales bacterium]
MSEHPGGDLIRPGARIGIVHYGEHIPLDDSYRPARMGQLASWLTEADCLVTRLVPTYSPFAGRQRPREWSGRATTEGVVEMVPTRPFTTSVSRARLGFLRDFAVNASRQLAAMDPFDALIVGYPPPGMVFHLRRRLGRDIPILADVRDLWPDALVPSDRRSLVVAGALAGTALAQELRLADGVVAMSETMLDRAPRRRRRMAIPACIPDPITKVVADDHGEAGLRAVFVGSFTQGVDFPTLIGGWRRFVEERRSSRPAPRLWLCGTGERADEVAALADGVAGIELVGRIPHDEVGAWLARADVGIAPTRPGFGTTISNKVVEYIGTGLFVLHTLEAEPAGRVEAGGLGASVVATPEGWRDGLIRLENRLDELRSGRSSRRPRAEATYGRAAIEPRWQQAINDLLIPPAER